MVWQKAKSAVGAGIDTQDVAVEGLLEGLLLFYNGTHADFFS